MVFVQHKLVGGEGPVPEEDYCVPYGQAEIRRQGKDVTVVATSFMVTLAMQVVERSFDSLKAAPQRVGNPNLSVPYSPVLEETVLPSAKKIEEAILRTMG